MCKWTIVSACFCTFPFCSDLLGEGRLPPSGPIHRGEQSSHSDDENETTWTRKIFRERNRRNVQDYRLDQSSLSLSLSIVHKSDEQTKMPKRMFSFFTLNIDVRLFFPLFSFSFVCLDVCVCVCPNSWHSISRSNGGILPGYQATDAQSISRRQRCRMGHFRLNVSCQFTQMLVFVCLFVCVWSITEEKKTSMKNKKTNGTKQYFPFSNKISFQILISRRTAFDKMTSLSSVETCMAYQLFESEEVLTENVTV